MAQSGVEPIGSMGYDAPLAVLVRDVRSCLYNYFKQLFAQVTNPPIDANREEIITATGTTIGPERNLMHPEPESCRQIRVKSPILSNEEFAKLRHIHRAGLQIDHAADFLHRRRTARKAWRRRWTSCARLRTASSPRAQHPDSVRSRHGQGECGRFRRCWPYPACIII